VRSRDSAPSSAIHLRPAALRGVSLLAAVSVAIAAPAAARAGDATGAVQPEDDDLARAKSLHEKAQTRYEMFDYVGAIDAWMEAYALLRADGNTREIRNAIVWNIATARIKAYEQDREVKHLHQGLQLMRKYLQEHLDLYGDREDARAEKDKIQKKVDELGALIKQSEKDDPPPTAPFPAATAAGSDKPPPKEKKIGPLGIVGITSMVLGAGFAGMWIAGMINAKQWRENFEKYPADRDAIAGEGRTANVISVVGGIGAAVFVATGAALLAVDLVTRKKKKSAAKSAFAPAVAPGFAGAAWTYRF
jgi:hypothetical protein